MPWWVDFVTVGILTYFLVSGFRRGFVVPFIRLVGLLLACGGGYLYGHPLGALLHEKIGLYPILCYPVGSFIVFLSISIFFSLVTGLINRRRRKRAAEDPAWRRPRWDSVLGGLFGLTWATLAIVVLVWAWKVLLLSPIGKDLPDLDSTWTGKLASRLLETGAANVVERLSGNPSLSRQIAHTINNPGELVRDMEGFLSSKHFDRLMADPRFKEALMARDRGSMLKNRNLDQLIQSPEFQKTAKKYNLIGPGGGPDAAKEALTDNLIGIVDRLQEITSNTNLQGLIGNQEIQAMIQSGDFRGLMAHPELNRYLSQSLGTPGP